MYNTLIYCTLNCTFSLELQGKNTKILGIKEFKQASGNKITPSDTIRSAFFNTYQ